MLNRQDKNTFPLLLQINREGQSVKGERNREGRYLTPFSDHLIFLEHIAQRNHHIAVFVIYMIGVVY